ncbi:hypothetical protein PAPHI01_2129 [Pancytospora philotis]|nr:hypothetical protein PAPHI01_2129 [Pancytospora philotis]
MKNFLQNLYRDVAEEAASSFIFGASTAAAKGALGNSSNIIATQVQALRRGIEQAKYAVAYTVVSAVLARLRVRARLAACMALFISSYLTGLRNGVRFALKNGLFGLAMNILSHAYG